jgi:A/G-specific adenine glycosylase
MAVSGGGLCLRIRSTARAAAQRRTALAGPLLAWFSRARRDLPWRIEPRDPYRTWVSEVMLQQTRVDVVVPYYLRFVARFPTLRALAKAPLDGVLAHWSGLGYYARARNLHRAAQAALREHGGALPRTSAELATLPGFGPYTAAAVASLAFGEQVALVDGNVARVLARVLRLPGDATQARVAAWNAARTLLPKCRAGEFNEALMELGATVCTPRAPACGGCPLARACRSRPRGDAEDFPAPKARKERPLLRWSAVALFRGDGAVLLSRRPAGSLFEGLWDLPSAELPAAAMPAGGSEAGAALDALAALTPRPSRLSTALRLHLAGTVAQTLTHRELSVSMHTASLASPFAGRSDRGAGILARCFPRGADLRWVIPRPGELRKLGLSSLARKCLRAALAARQLRGA